MFEHPDLNGRVAIVTGASRGIGKAIALALGRAGCAVCVAAKSTDAKPGLPGTIAETRAAIVEAGGHAIAVRADVRDEADIIAMVARTREAFGHVDILINNAGVLWWRDVVDTPVKRFDLLMAVNARASFAAAHHVAPLMIEQGWGHIITMSPPIDLRMLRGKVAYCVSKFGMTLIAHGLAAELAGTGVAVNALWPATVIESLASINFGLGGPAQWRKAAIMVDATMAVLSHTPGSLTGQALLDEDILRRVGVEDFDAYACVPGGNPIRIAGDDAVSASFGSGAGGPAAR